MLPILFTTAPLFGHWQVFYPDYFSIITAISIISIITAIPDGLQATITL